MKGGTESSSFRSWVILNSACRSGRTAWFRSSLRPWRCSGRVRRSDFGQRPRCWRALACIQSERNIVGSSGLSSGSSARRSSSVQIHWRVGRRWSNAAVSTSRAKPRSGTVGRHPDQRTLSSEDENVIVLSDGFYQELIARFRTTSKPSRCSPHRRPRWTFSCGCHTDVSPQEARSLYRCSATSGWPARSSTTDYSRPRRFRAMVEQWLGAIRALWPECPARLSSDGQAITISHAVAVLPTQSA